MPAPTPTRAGTEGSRTLVHSTSPPPPRGDQVKIEDDGSAAEKIVDYLAEKRLL